MIEKIFDKLEGIKKQEDRILFLLEHLPPNEKLHVEQFVIEKIHQQFAKEIQEAERKELTIDN